MSAASVLSPATPTTRTSGPRAAAASFTPAAARAQTVHQGAQNHRTVFFPASSAPAKAVPSTVVARKASDGPWPRMRPRPTWSARAWAGRPEVVGAGALVEGAVVPALAVPEDDAAGASDAAPLPVLQPAQAARARASGRQAGRGRSGRAHTPIIGDPVCVQPASRLTSG